MKAVNGNANNITRLFIILIIILPTLLIGCTSKKTSNDIPVNTIVDNIKNAADISSMKPANTARFKKLYNISSNEIDDFVLFTAPSSIKADELAIIKLKTSDDAKKIKDKILKRIDEHSTRFKDYIPEEYFLIEKNIISVKGNYILFVISKEADKIEASFKDSFK